MTQTTFHFPEPKIRARVAAALARRDELIGLLREAGCLSARQLAARGFDDRDLRIIMEHDKEGEIFSAPGCAGYRLFDDTPLEELGAMGALRSQARKMLRRYLVYSRRLHRMGGSAK